MEELDEDNNVIMPARPPEGVSQGLKPGGLRQE